MRMSMRMGIRMGLRMGMSMRMSTRMGVGDEDEYEDEDAGEEENEGMAEDEGEEENADEGELRSGDGALREGSESKVSCGRPRDERETSSTKVDRRRRSTGRTFVLLGDRCSSQSGDPGYRGSLFSGMPVLTGWRGVDASEAGTGPKGRN